MTSIKKCLLSALVVLAISESVLAASKSRTSTSAQISDLSRKLSRLEQKVSTLQRDVDLLKKTNGQLTGDLKTAVSEIQRVSTRNEGLQQMLNQFEKFFGNLYSESDMFDNPTARSVDKKINKLNRYIGDKEASLIEANPNYLYTVMGAEHEQTETNVTEEQVQSAVLQLATENKEMQMKVDQLEARVVEQSKSTSRGTTADDEAFANRLNTLEDLMAIMVTDNERSPAAVARSAAQQKEYQEMVDDFFVTERSVSSSRKSVFSVSRTSDLLGSYYPQIIRFDHVFVNKGGDFNVRNGTFICQWTGYYYFTFTLRSVDNHYIGVTLMKKSDLTPKPEVMTAIYTDSSERSTMESQSIALHLQTGDEVYLRLGPSDFYAINSDFYRYVTFSGFLIYKGN